jgi:subtilisin family serine protease
MRLDGGVEAEYDGLVQASLRPSELEAIAADTDITYIARPLEPVLDAVTEEGVAATNAGAWHAAGFNGAGSKVAIIDAGFIGYAGAQASGDLPPEVITQDFGCGGVATVTNHGTAVAEIVHKMAPGAQLYLICVATSVNLGQAKDFAVANGISIVNHSAGWPNSSRGDGSGAAGSPDSIVASARANGILWVNSAGNSGQRHWSGVYTDANLNGVHEFAPGDELNRVTIAGGGSTCVFLKWDAWPVTAQDYDLNLVQLSTLTTAASSTNLQTGSQAPRESLCFTNSGVTETFGIAITRSSAITSPRFDLMVSTSDLQYRVLAGSVVEPASSASAMAVGAVCWQNSGLRTYSSQGPTIDGRVKPDIAGPDGTSSSVYGASSGCTGGFQGTSASSPHVAGAAALVRQAHPTFGPDQLQAFLEGRAIDLGTIGRDNGFGAGKVWLGSPGLSTSVSGTPTPITAGGTLTASWSNIGAPTATDWIALARVGSATTSYVTWRYTTGTASGSGPLVVPASAAAGTYELRLFAADGFTLRATSTSIVLN